MMGAHANSMLAQAPAQSQFLPQSQFPSSSGALSVSNVGMGQPAAQAGVPQVLSTLLVVIFLIFICIFYFIIIIFYLYILNSKLHM